jgi:hypothetical protein
MVPNRRFAEFVTEVRARQFSEVKGVQVFQSSKISAVFTKLCLKHEINNKTTPCSKFLLDKLIVIQLVNKFSAFYATRRFITFDARCSKD